MSPKTPEDIHTIKQTQKKYANYLVLVNEPMYRVSPESFAVESVFGEHLLALNERIRSKFRRFVVAAPIMPIDEYEQKRKHLLEINEKQSSIYFEQVDMCQFKLESFLKACFNQKYYKAIFKVCRLVGQSEIVHTGPSLSFFPTPFFLGLLYAVLNRKKTIFVWDNDLRNSARRLYKSGKISLKDYLVLGILYDFILVLQIKFGIMFCSLVLLKPKQMIDDYAKNKCFVKRILNPAYSKEHVMSDVDLAKKIALIQNQNTPLELIYFGRLVYYKGVDLSLRAVKLARNSGANIRFSVIGQGEEKKNLLRLTDELSLKDIVTFHEPIQYGTSLFYVLCKYHILLATLLWEETPRSALDAMASGMAVLTFDTRYYRDVSDSGAVCIVPWPSVEELVKRIVYFDKNRNALQEMMRKAVAFARENTQEIWLDRRLEWTFNLFEKNRGGHIEK